MNIWHLVPTGEKCDAKSLFFTIHNRQESLRRRFILEKDVNEVIGILQEIKAFASNGIKVRFLMKFLLTLLCSSLQ